MKTESQGRRISVGNRIVDGVTGGPLPTFMLNLLGLSDAGAAAAIRQVALLQTIAPVFQVVALSDRPMVFGAVRAYGWPVEHLPTPEHAERVLGLHRAARYRRHRIALAESHFHDITVVSCVGPQSATAMIANLIGRIDLAALVHNLSEASSDQDFVSPGDEETVRCRWSDVWRDLKETGSARFASSEGSLNLACRDEMTGSIAIVGSSSAATADFPPWVTRLEVRFAPGSSLAFESYTYAVLARVLGTMLAVVIPWRDEAVLSDDVLPWVDLALTMNEGTLRVRSEYLENYVLLAGDAALRWDTAQHYGAIRRASKSLAGRESGLFG